MQPVDNPKLIHLYIKHCAIGFGLAAIFVAILLWQDVAGLGGLIARSDVGYLAVFMLWVFHGTVFGGAQFGVMLMLLPTDNDQSGGSRTPVTVKVGATSPQLSSLSDGNRGNRRR